MTYIYACDQASVPRLSLGLRWRVIEIEKTLFSKCCILNFILFPLAR